MGVLRDGEWVTEDVATNDKSGRFQRSKTAFRNWITADGAPGPTGMGGFAAESGRYHLYVSYACPWAHRTLIYRALKGLEDHITVDVVHPVMLDDGWTLATDFDGATGDTVLGKDLLREVYLASDPATSGKVTVPILWDRRKARIVSNESAEIIRMLNSAFDAITGNTLDFWPEALRDEIETVNARVYDGFNNGVYRAGFASSQEGYDEAVAEVFETLDWLEERLSASRYLLGDRLTEADWRLLPTLLRFDLIYHGHFKCNRRRLIDYPSIWGYARELYQIGGVAGTVRFDHITHHYHRSHPSINPYGIVPTGPVLDWTSDHGRDQL